MVGLIGLLFSVVPIIGVIAWPLVIIGLILAGIGLGRARSGQATNGGLATAGLVCSGLGLVVCIFYAAVFSAAVSSSTPVATRDYPTAPTVVPSRAPTVTIAPARIGQQVQDGDFAFTVTGVEKPGRTLGSGAFASKAQGTWVLVRVTVTNNGDDSGTFSSGKQTLLDAQGREFDADASAAIMNVPDSESSLTTINPGNSVDGTLVFDLPVGVTPTAIELHDSYFSRGVTVALTG